MKDVIIIGIDKSTALLGEKILSKSATISSILILEKNLSSGKKLEKFEINAENVFKINQDFEWGFKIHTDQNIVYHCKTVIITGNLALSEQLKKMKIDFTRRNPNGYEDRVDQIPGLYVSSHLIEDDTQFKNFIDYNLDLTERMRMKESYMAIKRGSQIF